MKKLLGGLIAGVVLTKAIQSETGKKVVSFLKEKGQEIISVTRDRIEEAISEKPEEEPVPAPETAE